MQELVIPSSLKPSSKKMFSSFETLKNGLMSNFPAHNIYGISCINEYQFVPSSSFEFIMWLIIQDTSFKKF